MQSEENTTYVSIVCMLYNPAGTQRLNNVDSTLIICLDVECTLNRRCFSVVCLLGMYCADRVLNGLLSIKQKHLRLCFPKLFCILNSVLEYAFRILANGKIPFFSYRQQRDFVNDETKRWAPVLPGVPQVAVLSTLLFPWYINVVSTDIWLRNVTIRIFATVKLEMQRTY